MKNTNEIYFKEMLIVIFLSSALCTDLGAQTSQELVKVIKSDSIYDPSTYTVQCNQRYGEAQNCFRVARPDKPFPLPSGFWTTVERKNGEIESFHSANHYRPGVTITAEVSEIRE